MKKFGDGPLVCAVVRHMAAQETLARIAARQGEDVKQASREAQEPDQAPENTTKSPKGKQ